MNGKELTLFLVGMSLLSAIILTLTVMNIKYNHEQTMYRLQHPEVKQ